MKLLSSLLVITLMFSMVSLPFAMASSSGLVGVNVNSQTGSASMNDPDLNNDGNVNERDLDILLANWGPCNNAGTCYDLTGDKKIDGSDLGNLLGSWSNTNLASSGSSAGNPTRPMLISTGNSFSGSVTSDDVSDITGIEKEIIEEDIDDILSDSSNSVSFPGKIMTFKATADDDSINMVRGYIGSQRKAQVIGDDVESGEVVYRGRVVLEIEGQTQVESYLIVDGSEVDYIYGLVPIEDGKIASDQPTSKLLFNPSQDEAKFSFGDERGVVELDIISLEKSVVRQKPNVDNNRLNPNLGTTEERRPMPFWKRWFYVPTPQSDPSDANTGTSDNLELSDERIRDRGMFGWILNIFDSNSVDDERIRDIKNSIDNGNSDVKFREKWHAKANVFDDKSAVHLAYKFDLKSDGTEMEKRLLVKRILDRFSLTEEQAREILDVNYHTSDPVDESKADINGDGVVDNLDLDLLMNSWGVCQDSKYAISANNCVGDIDGSGEVDVSDLIFLLSEWTSDPSDPYNPNFKVKDSLDVKLKKNGDRVSVDIKMRFTSGSNIDAIVKEIVRKTKITEDEFLRMADFEDDRNAIVLDNGLMPVTTLNQGS